MGEVNGNSSSRRPASPPPSPGGEGKPAKRKRSQSFDATAELADKISNTKQSSEVRMVVRASLKGMGLGKEAWWDEQEDDEDEDEADIDE